MTPVSPRHIETAGGLKGSPLPIPPRQGEGEKGRLGASGWTVAHRLGLIAPAKRESIPG